MKQLNCRAVTALAVIVGVVWMAFDSLTSGALGRSVGWERIPLNVVIACDALVWIVGLSVCRGIDRFTILGATVMAGFQLFIPHLSVSLFEVGKGQFLSPAVYDASVFHATLWTSLVVFGLSWLWDLADNATRRELSRVTF